MSHQDIVNDLEILFQDESFVAVNKPPGLLVHRTALDGKETRFAVQTVRDQIGQKVYPVHRLDKPTSGALVFALSPEAAQQLCELFINHQVQKEYLAIVRGFTQASGTIDTPLKQMKDSKVQKVSKEEVFQEAVTNYQTLATSELAIAIEKYPQSRFSLVKALPKTGRTHQIRRHLKYISHPIIGDTTHGSRKHNRYFAEHYNTQQMFLTCTRMTFDHPLTKIPLSITAKPTEDFKRILTELNLNTIDN
jgi:tRNA pseudouridine65 synthase